MLVLNETLFYMPSLKASSLLKLLRGWLNIDEASHIFIKILILPSAHALRVKSTSCLLRSISTFSMPYNLQDFKCICSFVIMLLLSEHHSLRHNRLNLSLSLLRSLSLQIKGRIVLKRNGKMLKVCLKTPTFIIL